MGLRTIAEKVETQSARKLLSKIGVEFVQGHVISKPIPIENYIDSHGFGVARKAA